MTYTQASPERYNATTTTTLRIRCRMRQTRLTSMKKYLPVLIIVILAIVALFTLTLNPPWAYQRNEKKQGLARDFMDENLKLTWLSSKPNKQKYPFNYDIPQKPNQQILNLSLTQNGTYQDNKTVQTSLNVDIHIEKIKQNDILIRFENLNLTLNAQNENIDSTTLKTMLQGIMLRIKFDPHRGLGIANPLTDINPQIIRPLYLLSDALRMAYPSHPNQALTPQSQWQYTGTNQSNNITMTTTTDTLTPMPTFESNLNINTPSNTQTTAKITSKFTQNGYLQFAKGTLSHTNPTAKTRYTLDFKITHKQMTEK